MSVIGSNVLAGASGQAADGYLIERSLRLNSDDSARLTRTAGTPSASGTWTASVWVKRAKLGSESSICGGREGGDATQIYFKTDNTLRWYEGGADMSTTAVFRDVSAWSHFVFAKNGSTSCTIYHNGVQIQQNTTSIPSTSKFNTASAELFIGAIGLLPSGIAFHADNYLADVHFIDGQALAPTDFGEYDDNGVWQPKAYAGTYGTNGFHLDFSDNSSNAALGTDSSTNNNDWTVNNITAEAPGLATAKQGMDVVTYSGTGATQAIGGLQFQPDFVWIKRRNGANAHALFDVIRGVTKALESSNTGTEKTNDPPITSFDSNGFTVNGTYAQTNASGGTYVGWCWKAGGTASSNTDGSITSQVSANTTYGFSVVSYTGNGTQNATVGHGLNAEPALLITKNRNSAQQWDVYHKEVGYGKVLRLNSTAASATASDVFPSSNTSSVFKLGSSASQNGSSNNMIAYCWSEVAGFSKFGSYTGTGAVGHKITTGFKPAYILFKRTDSLSNWRIVDEKRGTSSLNAETAEAEQTLNFAINADGFTINETGNNPNASGGTYIYAAFAGTPAGEDVDSLFDSPTNGVQTDTGLGGEVSGNYATWNPLSSSGVTLSNGNLDATNSNSATKIASSTIVPTAKCYWEVTIETPRTGAIGGIHGVNAQGARPDHSGGAGIYLAGSGAGGGTYVNGTQTAADYSASAGDIIGFAFDPSTRSLIITRNGSSVGTLTAPDTDNLQPVSALNQSVGINVNFGQRPFAFAPSGFKALCTANLSDPTIADGSDYFEAKTYTGNGGTQSITGFEFSPDLVWIKGRSGATDHVWCDTVRGPGYRIRSNLTTAEDYGLSNVSAFNANSFDIGSNSRVNTSGATYVGWTWDAGHPATATTGAVSFDGTGDWLSIPTSSDFSIGTSDDFTFEAFIYPTSVSDTTAFGIGTNAGFAYRIISGSPYLYVANSGGVLNTGTIVAKKWTHIAVTRNSGTLYSFIDGVLAGSVANSGSFDGTQENFIGAANLTGAASPGYLFTGQISNVRWVKGTALYTSNFTPPTAELTNVTNTKLLCCQSTTSATAAAVTPGTITANGDASATTFNSLDAFSVNGTGYATTSAAGITEGTIALTGASVNQSAGFSVVTFNSGNSDGEFSVGHSLGVAPKMIIMKSRTRSGGPWWVHHLSATDTTTKYLQLSTTSAVTDNGGSGSIWGAALPTSTVFGFSVGAGRAHTQNEDIVAYCFAPVEGYSSFGSYTGNGSTDGPFVYTGFRPKWVLIKITNATDSWLLYDSVRSTYNVVDDFLQPNSSEAEATGNSNALDFLSNGFKLKGSVAGTNGNNNTYLYACFSENPFKYARAR